MRLGISAPPRPRPHQSRTRQAQRRRKHDTTQDNEQMKKTSKFRRRNARLGQPLARHCCRVCDLCCDSTTRQLDDAPAAMSTDCHTINERQAQLTTRTTTTKRSQESLTLSTIATTKRRRRHTTTSRVGGAVTRPHHLIVAALTIVVVALLGEIASIAQSQHVQATQSLPQLGITRNGAQFAPQDQHQHHNQHQHPNQQQYLRSPLHQQTPSPPSLVNYQNDQPQPQQLQRMALQNAPSSAFFAPQSMPLQRQPYRATYSQDQDNVIESTTTNKNLLLPFPLSISAPISSALQLQQQQQQTQHSCQLPHTWAGKWYQANKEQIRITNTEISDKGICRDKKGDKYLFEFDRQSHQQQHHQHQQQHQQCLICLVINERHLNVLQYKESDCLPVPSQYLNKSASADNQLVVDNEHALLDSICSEITGDAPLESLFRLDTPATECPITGKYHFSYDSCREPLSSLDSCIDKKQLHFKFSACPDVAGSESKSEVLKCYADWSEGNNYYMIGRLEHASNNQDKGKFRCFMYEKTPEGEYIPMSQTLEESCYGLINAHEGPKTYRLTTRASSSNKCQFPSYIQNQSQDWLSVDNSLIYMFNQNSTKYQVKETKEGKVIEEATCLQQINYAAQPQAQSRISGNSQATTATRRYPPSPSQFNQIDQSAQQVVPTPTRQASSDFIYLVQITKDCYTTEYCVRFYRRTSGIVQIDYFSALPGSDGHQRCRNAFITAPQTQIITSTNLEHQRCPFDGAYTIEAPIETDFSYNPSNIFICPRQSFLTAQCDHPSRLKIHYKCTPGKTMYKNLYCQGSWTTNGWVRLLLADDDRQRYSAWYKDYSSSLTSDEIESTTVATGQYMGYSRSQQLIGLSLSANQQNAVNPQGAVVDLQIALLAPSSVVSKAMQVRLTRRSQCSDIRGYITQSSISSMSSSSVPSYASPSATSSATSVLSSIVIFQTTFNCPANYNSILMMLVLTLFSLIYSASSSISSSANSFIG